MSTRSLPLGWGQRANASDPDAQSMQIERPGDWRELDLASKYKRDGEKYREGDENGKVPLGFGNRSNTKTLEELSLSASASEVAIAEVNLKGMQKKAEVTGTGTGGTGDLGYVKPYNPYAAPKSSQSSALLAPTSATPTPAEAVSPAAASVQQSGAPPSNLLIQAVLQMDARMKSMEMQMDTRMSAMESNLYSILDRQEKTLAALEALSKGGGK